MKVMRFRCWDRGLGLLIIGLAVGPAQAKLKWADPVQSFKPLITAKQVVAEFKFVNVGDEPVTITSVKPSCDQTTTKLAKRMYQPGESGRILSTFAIGQYRGIQIAKITVRTDNAEAPTDTLVMRVKIPELLRIYPIHLNWSEAEPREPKVLCVTIVHDEPVHVQRVETTNQAFIISVDSIPRRNAYLISVTPPPAEQAEAATTLRIITDYPSPKAPRSFAAFAKVIPASDAKSLPLTNTPTRD